MPNFSQQSARADSETWQQSLAKAIRDPDELIDLLELPERFREPAGLAAQRFPLMVTRSYLARMRPRDPDDPLLRQVLPLNAETEVVPGFVDDAVGDSDARRVPGLLQKYDGRALLIATGSCAIHCRYCFRREYPYSAEPRRLDDWSPAFELLEADTSISEVILSGGDPLMLTDRRLNDLLERLDQISHLERLRVHTRLPIVLPNRVTDALLNALHAVRMTCFMVVHANHSAELDNECATALTNIRDFGIPVLNQAVLLRGVNDTFEAQYDLNRRLLELGTIPYYLHQLDQVRGTAHFAVNDTEAAKIVKRLRMKLPGYGVPRLVREIPGESSKTPL